MPSAPNARPLASPAPCAVCDEPATTRGDLGPRVGVAPLCAVCAALELPVTVVRGLLVLSRRVLAVRVAFAGAAL